MSYLNFSEGFFIRGTPRSRKVKNSILVHVPPTATRTTYSHKYDNLSRSDNISSQIKPKIKPVGLNSISHHIRKQLPSDGKTQRNSLTAFTRNKHTLLP